MQLTASHVTLLAGWDIQDFWTNIIFNSLVVTFKSTRNRNALSMSQPELRFRLSSPGPKCKSKIFITTWILSNTLFQLIGIITCTCVILCVNPGISLIVEPSPKTSPLRRKPKPIQVLYQNQSPIGTRVTLQAHTQYFLL